MNMDLAIKNEISQKLSVEMIQSLEILSFTEEELTNYIYEKAINNPLLNIIEKDLTVQNQILELATSNFKNLDFYGNQTRKLDYQLVKEETYFNEQYLIDQIPLNINLSNKEIKILKYFIENLDDYFFLDLDLDRVSELFNIEINELIKLIELLKTFEPKGIGMKNLKEYLIYQIEQNNNAPNLASVIVKNHLELITTKSIKKLTEIYNVSKSTIEQNLDYIKNLNSPSLKQVSNCNRYLIPDVDLIKYDDQWIIELYRPMRPKIEINEEYINLLKINIEHSEYLKKCMKDAVILTQGITQRDQTIYRIMTILLEWQKEFFEEGYSKLRPLTMKVVGSYLNLHDSTISRAIRYKTVRTPFGIIPLKNLFGKGLNNFEGNNTSVIQVKINIKEIIDNEKPNDPISDNRLTEILISKGIKISRRTVAKYREELSIPNSSKRRRESSSN